MLKQTLLDIGQKEINHYLSLSIGGKKVTAPYYINESYDEEYIKKNSTPSDIARFKKRRTGNRASIGKGSPQDLEKEVRKIAKQKRFNLTKATKEEIRDFMMQHGLGIECSGFVTHVLNQISLQKYHKPIWKNFKIHGSILRKLLFALRPIENISAKVLEENSVVLNISDIQPGDIITTWNGKHVLLIYSVTYGENKKPISFEYVNSTWWYGEKNGIRKGKVQIIKPKGKLIDQKWMDDGGGKKINWTYEGVKNRSKVMRLNEFF